MKRGLYRQPTGSLWWNRWNRWNLWPLEDPMPEHFPWEKPQPMDSLHWGRLLAGTAACEEEVTQQQVSCLNLWPMGSLLWDNPFLKDCTRWKSPTLEHLKNCSAWERPMLEMFMKDCHLWEGPCIGAGEECKEEGSQRWVLWADHSSHSPSSLGRGCRRVMGEAEPLEGRDRVFDEYQASQGQPTTIKKMLWTQRELQALQEQSQVWYQNGKGIFLYQAHQMSSCAAPFQAAGPGAAASGVQLWLTQQCHRSQALAGDISAKLMALPGFLNLLAEFCLVISIYNWESGYLGLLFLARA